MHIREARLEDIDSIALLFEQLWPGKPIDIGALREVFARGLASDDWFYACAELEGKVVGFGAVMLHNSLWQEGYVAYGDILIVDKDIRGGGVGSELIEAGLEWARSRGCKKFEADSALHRERAHALYERLGFVKEGYLFRKDL